LKLQDLFALPSDLDAHVLDFGTDVIQTHSLAEGAKQQKRE
jgi:hypothetical protein